MKVLQNQNARGRAGRRASYYDPPPRGRWSLVKKIEKKIAPELGLYF